MQRSRSTAAWSPSVTIANTLAELCERIGADWSEIAPALKLDARIGPYAYLAPGLGLAGGNLERDLATVMRLSEQHGTDAGMIRAIVANSRHRKDWALRDLHEALLATTPQARIGVLGLAYKENTHSVKNSAALALIAQLAGMAGARVRPGGARLRRAASEPDRGAERARRRARTSMRSRS